MSGALTRCWRQSFGHRPFRSDRARKHELRLERLYLAHCEPAPPKPHTQDQTCFAVLVQDPFRGIAFSDLVFRKGVAGNEDNSTEGKTEDWFRPGKDHTSQRATVDYDDDGWPARSVCGAYADEDEGNSTDTESETEFANSPEWRYHLGSFRGATLEGLKLSLIHI